MAASATPGACSQLPPASPRKSKHSERARIHTLSRNLQLRLQYARLKVVHGWHRQTLTEVENLYFRHFHAQSLERGVQEKQRKAIGKRAAPTAEPSGKDGDLDAKTEEGSEVGGDQDAAGKGAVGEPHPSASTVNGLLPAAALSTDRPKANSRQRDRTTSPLAPYRNPFPHFSSQMSPARLTSAPPHSPSPRLSSAASAGPKTYDDFWKARSSPATAFSPSSVAALSAAINSTTAGSTTCLGPHLSPTAHRTRFAASGRLEPAVAPKASSMGRGVTGQGNNKSYSSRNASREPSATAQTDPGDHTTAPNAAEGNGTLERALRKELSFGSLEGDKEFTLDDIDRMDWGATV